MMARTTFTVLAPVKGALVPLNQVPDPVFSQKMLGDGIAIDPADGTLHAPFDGKIINMNPNLHAFVIEKNGIELLVHIGLDTVRLKGKGFTPLVKVGDTVSAGQPILHFDLARITSALDVPFVLCIVTSPSHAQIRPSDCELVQVGQPLFTVTVPAAKSTAASTNFITSAPITITNAHGLHARPAGLLARLCGEYPYDISICKKSQCVNAKSIVSIMGLALAQGDSVTLQVHAPQTQAQACLERLEKAFASGFGENATPDDSILEGVCVCEGTASGPAFLWKTSDFSFEETTQDPQADLLLLQTSVRTFIAHTKERLSTLPQHTRTILETQLDFVQDPDLMQTAQEFILQGKSAMYGFYHAVEKALHTLQQTNSPLLQERTADLYDLRRQILASLNGQNLTRPSVAPHSVVIAEELLPSDVAYLQGKAAAVVLTKGSATSHVGILLKNSGIVTLAKVAEQILTIAPGTQVLVNATQGKVWLNPPASLTVAVPSAAQPDLHADPAPANTLDGTTIEVSGNVNSLAQAQQAAQQGADGLGLVRTEILLAAHTTSPAQEEQQALYQQIVDLFEKPVTLRLVDAGADKPLPFLNFPPEKNPMLGVRGIRAFATNEDFFRTQLRALLNVHCTVPLRILLPMVTQTEEVVFFRKLLQEEQGRLQQKTSVQLGVMIETPAAALQSKHLAQVADFFSIGTNDLTQYTLAMDRTHSLLASRQDALDPAVLQLVAFTCQAAQKADIPVAVCGAAASDAFAACIFMGLGVRELAVPTKCIVPLKQKIRHLTLKKCAKLAKQSLACQDASQVRQLLKPLQGVLCD